MKEKFLKLKSFLILALVLGGSFWLSGEVLAQADPTSTFEPSKGFFKTLISPFSSLLIMILYGIFRLIFLFLILAMSLLDAVVSPVMFNEVFFSSVAIEGINTAWGFVRDFFNLFFILIVVLIGLSVILGVSKFKDKTMLFRVALAAMLINFSKAITLFFIDMSEVFLRFFADGLGDDFSTKFLGLISFKEVLSGTSLKDEVVYMVVIIFVAIMTIIMAVMIFYLAISLIIRMIAFWVLIILSPIAFFGIAMEGTKLGSLKDEWIKNLISWCFYGPIMLFFIWLAVILAATIGNATFNDLSHGINTGDFDTAKEGLSGFLVNVCGMIIPYITAIYLLFYGYDKAKSVSSGAATSILNAGNAKISQINKLAKSKGYGAGLIFPGTRKGIQEGVKTRMEKTPVLKSFTKKGREDAQNKINAKWKDKIGGEEGSATRDYNQSKAQEVLKKWNDNGVSGKELDDAMKGDDEAKKIAAITYKSKNNKFGTDEKGQKEYQESMDFLKEKGYVNLREKVEKETKGEKLGLVIKNQIREKEQELEEKQKRKLTEEEKIEIRRKVHEDNLNGNLKKIFEKQDKVLYEQKGVLDYLYKKHENKKVTTRKKFAENIKDSKAEEFLLGSKKGQYLLGVSDNRIASSLGENLIEKLYTTNQQKIDQTEI